MSFRSLPPIVLGKGDWPVIILVLLVGCSLWGKALGQQPEIRIDKLQPPEVVRGFKPVVERQAVIFFDFKHSALLPSIRVFDSSAWRPCNIPEDLAGRLRDRANQAVDQVRGTCELTPEQVKKLALAAELEQRTILRQIIAMVAEYDGVPHKPETLARLYDEMRKLQARVLKNPVHSDSLFATMLDQLLTPKQHAQIAQSHLDWLSKAIARSAVLSEAESQSFAEQLNVAAEKANFNGNRKEFLIQVIANLDHQRLSHSLDPRSRLAILRFCNYFQEH